MSKFKMGDEVVILNSNHFDVFKKGEVVVIKTKQLKNGWYEVGKDNYDTLDADTYDLALESEIELSYKHKFNNKLNKSLE